LGRPFQTRRRKIPLLEGVEAEEKSYVVDRGRLDALNKIKKFSKCLLMQYPGYEMVS
jgi:hypothetical protein